MNIDKLILGWIFWPMLFGCVCVPMGFFYAIDAIIVRYVETNNAISAGVYDTIAHVPVSDVWSFTEAKEIIRRQNAFIAELETALLNEEREQRIDDVQKAVTHLKSTIQAWKELKRLYDASLDQEHEQKLEDIGQKLEGSENKVRQLESQLTKEQQKVEDLWHETCRLKKELEIEKAAREEAKVFVLEWIKAAIQKLKYETKCKLKAARECIMLRY